MVPVVPGTCPLAIKASGVSCVIAKSFARIFYRNAINIGLPILISPEAAENIEAGARIEVDLDSGYDNRTGERQDLPGRSFLPEYMQELIKAGGLIEKVKREVGQSGKNSSNSR